MGSIPWGLMLVDGVDSLFVQLVFAYGMMCLLPMRRKALFCAVYVLVPVFLNTVGYYVVNPGFLPGLIVLALACYVLPFVLYEGSVVVRLVAVAASATASMATEALFYAAFDLFMGFPLPSGDDFAAAFLVNVPGWLLLETLRAVVSLTLLLLLAWVFRSRRTVKTSRASSGSLRFAEEEEGRLPVRRVDGHGWGTGILEDLTKRYGGSFKTERRDGVWTATAVLELS